MAAVLTFIESKFLLSLGSDRVQKLCISIKLPDDVRLLIARAVSAQRRGFNKTSVHFVFSTSLTLSRLFFSLITMLFINGIALR